jgi:hypothetical protein
MIAGSDVSFVMKITSAAGWGLARGHTGQRPVPESITDSAQAGGLVFSDGELARLDAG